MLIDGGPGRSVLRELGRVMPFYDRTIDVVIATHPDADHIGGLPSVFEKYHVKNFVESGLDGKTDLWFELQKSIQNERSKKIIVRDGSKIDFGGTVFTVLAPSEISQNMETNDASIVGRLVYGESEFVFTGDAPIYVENKIVNSHLLPELKADVLKAGHHGSKTSSGESFLKAVSPKYTIISAGKDNRYGHPHKEVIDRLNELKTQILRTDILGRIVFESDGKRLEITHP
jgi:competence protein ComEC